MRHEEGRPPRGAATSTSHQPTTTPTEGNQCHECSGGPRPVEITFPELLALLDYLDGDTTEHISVCQQAGPLSFSSAVMLPCDAPRYIEWQTDIGHRLALHRTDFDFWFSMNPTAGPARSRSGRGRSCAVIRLAALYADIDVGKPGYCPNLATALAIIAWVSEVLGERPTAITYSGHGLQPIWTVERESATRLSNAAAERLLRWFGEVVKAVAAHHECKADPVYDLARVLRVPETLNCKVPDAKVPVRCVLDAGRGMTVERITLALRASGVAERRPAVRLGPTGNGVKPFTRRCLIERVRQAPEGTRNRTLYGAAKDAARQGDYDEQMRDALTDAADAAGLDYDEIGPTIESGFCRGEDEEPDGVPAQVWPTPSVRHGRVVSGTRGWQ